jgi:hypothetical protein
MAKRKMRKFEEGGDVDPLEAVNASEDAQAIMDQAKGEEILKRMRDEESAPMPKPRMQVTPTPRAKASPDVMKPAPKSTMVEKTVVKTEPAAPKARPNENYSNEGRGRAAPSPSAKKETYRDFSGKTREKSESERPDFGGAIGRGISNFFGSIRERGRRSNPDAYAKGGSVGSASKRADGIAQRGKTKGKIC